jgi:hypothetical protein
MLIRTAWIALIYLFSFLFTGTAGAQPSTAKKKDPRSSSFQVKVSEGSLSLDARDAPLAKVLAGRRV